MTKAEKINKKIAKDKLQLKKWKLKQEQHRPKFYFLYFVLILCLAYVVDEIATNMNFMMQTEVLKEYFDNDLQQYALMFTIVQAVSFLTFFFKALADKFGRKPFIVINTMGLAVGMFLCFISQNLVIYLIGSAIIYFFIPCDVQVVYILESAPPKKKAMYAALGKALGVMSIAIIPILRNAFKDSHWQMVFLIPAIIGLVVSFLALFFMKESDVFIETKIKYYRKELRSLMNPLEEKPEKKSAANSQGGLIAAIRYMFENKTLLWLFLIMTIFSVCNYAVNNYAIIMASDGSIFTDPVPLIEAENNKNLALIVYPFMCAAIELLAGFIVTKRSKRTGAMFSGSVAFIGFLFFVISVKAKWPFPWLVGIFLGLFIGGYFSSLDTFNVYTVEQSPANLRSSVMSINSAGLSVGALIATAIVLWLSNLTGETIDIGYFSLLMLSPCLFLSLLLVALKLPEDKKKKKQLKKVKLYHGKDD